MLFVTTVILFVLYHCMMYIAHCASLDIWHALNVPSLKRRLSLFSWTVARHRGIDIQLSYVQLNVVTVACNMHHSASTVHENALQHTRNNSDPCMLINLISFRFKSCQFSFCVSATSARSRWREWQSVGFLTVAGKVAN